MIRKLSTAAASLLTAGALTSCFTLPFKRQPEVQPVQETPKEKPADKPKAKPNPPAAPVAEANAYYETGAASTSFFVARPESDKTDRLPDKILRRGTVVQVLVPKAGSGWSKVKLVDAQVGYVLLSELDVVAASVRPSGFPTRGSGIDTALDLPEPPTAVSPSPSPGATGSTDTISLDGLDLEVPSSSSGLPVAPESSGSSGLDDISLDNLPGL
ncbi:MAG: hypothetical protein O3C21_00125 [Verrucomicrobia bacterium]|nr:hypothetical protein [Verrucomicrobiota bacterium]